MRLTGDKKRKYIGEKRERNTKKMRGARENMAVDNLRRTTIQRRTHVKESDSMT